MPLLTALVINKLWNIEKNSHHIYFKWVEFEIICDVHRK